MKYLVTSIVILILAGAVWSRYSTEPLSVDAKATLIVVEKNKHQLTLYLNNKVLRTYRVSLGRGDSRAKQREGDDRTPEGRYTIDAKSADSQFHKSLHISYPSHEDIARAKLNGNTPGGAVMIHGLRNDLAWLGRFHLFRDWTRGCIAVTNPEIDELWTVVPIDTPIEIKP